MDYKSVLKADLEKGYSKKDLEFLIGLPQNNLAGFLLGNREFSKKNLLKIERWEKSEKPDPLDVHKLMAPAELLGKKTVPAKVKSGQIDKPIQEKTFEQYAQMKIECETIEQWAELKAEISNSPLPSMNKKILLS